MNFTYENQGTSSFLVYPLNPEDELDTMGIGMIGNNHIPHILPISFTQIDEARYLRYSISSKITLESFFSGMVNRKRLLGIFIGICEAIEAGDEYMLESSMLVLDKKYIFANVSTDEPYLVYLPVLNERDPLDLGRFFKEIMFSTQFDPSEDCSYVAGIINFLNTSTHFSLKEFETLLYKLKDGTLPGTLKEEEKMKVPAATTTPSGAAVRPTPAVRLTPVTPAPATAPVQPVSAESAAPPVPGPAPAPVSSPPERKESITGASEARTPSVTGLDFAIPGQDAAAKKPVPFHMPKGQTPRPEKKKGFLGFGGKKEKAKQEAPAVQSAPPEVSPPPVHPAPAVPGFGQAQAQTPAWVKNTSSVLKEGQTTVLRGGTAQTTVLSNGAAETTILTNPEAEARPVRKPVLVRAKNGAMTPIDKILFRIGTERSFANLWISDNSAVSHAHADIINRDGDYFVRDNNSTNHTYLNGTQLVSNQEYQLKSGDELVFANERFLFKIE